MRAFAYTRGMRRLALLSTCVGVFWRVSASATIVLPLSLEEMTERADLVVEAVVEGSEAKWNTRKDRISTLTTLVVRSALVADGDAPSVVVVRTLGGEVGDVGMRVAGTARFAPGERVLVFLRHSKSGQNYFTVVGMSQGKFRLVETADGVQAVPGIEGLAFLERDGSVQHASPPEAMAWDSLRDRILRVSAARRPSPAPAPASVPVAPAPAVPAPAPQVVPDAP